MIIYKAENQFNGKVYIGLTTTSIEERKKRHKTSMNTGSDTYFHNALRKYGWDNFSWEIIDTTDNIETLKEKEIYWIKQYRSYANFPNSNGYNLTLGGDGALGVVWSEERRLEKSKQTKEWYKNNGYSEEAKAKQAVAMREFYKNNPPPVNALIGEKNNNSKITDKERLEIHDLANCGLFKLKEIADIYSISLSLVSYYKNHFDKYAKNLLKA